MQNESLFRDKPVWSAIFSMAIPSVFTILVMIVYNMADLFFIGRLGATAPVGAISIVGPVFSLLSAVSTMIGVGGCATIREIVLFILCSPFYPSQIRRAIKFTFSNIKKTSCPL